MLAHPMLVSTGAVSALALLGLAVATRTRGAQRLDDAAERVANARRATLTPFARIGTLPGERSIHPTMGALSAGAILFLRPHAGVARTVLPLAAASLGAILLHHGIKLVYRRPRPEVALARGKTEPAFPSGHTADATAVVLTSAWMLSHQGTVVPVTAFAIAIGIALVTGVSRVALGWHWATDVLGGWLAGIVVASQCVLLFYRLG